MKARLKNYRQSPRKVRLVADLVRGKAVDRALISLSMLPKRAAPAVKKLIESAVANAKNVKGVDKDKLVVKNISVDKGFVFKRMRARSRGRSAMIRKKTSHIVIELSEKKTGEVKSQSPEKSESSNV